MLRFFTLGQQVVRPKIWGITDQTTDELQWFEGTVPYLYRAEFFLEDFIDQDMYKFGKFAALFCSFSTKRGGGRVRQLCQGCPAFQSGAKRCSDAGFWRRALTKAVYQLESGDWLRVRKHSENLSARFSTWCVSLVRVTTAVMWRFYTFTVYVISVSLGPCEAIKC